MIWSIVERHPKRVFKHEVRCSHEKDYGDKLLQSVSLLSMHAVEEVSLDSCRGDDNGRIQREHDIWLEANAM